MFDLLICVAKVFQENIFHVLAMSLEESRRSQRPYRYGMVLLCVGALINWLGLAENYVEPVRYVGVACIVAGALLICAAMCCWLHAPPTRTSTHTQHTSHPITAQVIYELWIYLFCQAKSSLVRNKTWKSHVKKGIRTMIHTTQIYIYHFFDIINYVFFKNLPSLIITTTRSVFLCVCFCNVTNNYYYSFLIICECHDVIPNWINHQVIL